MTKADKSVCAGCDCRKSSSTVTAARQQAAPAFERMLQASKTVNSILSLGLHDSSIETVLRQVLHLLLSIEWLCLESRGCVFMVGDEPDQLLMVEQNGLADPIQKACAQLAFGKCLCGLAASTQEVQFADCIDHRHEVTYSGIMPHGHYCVPIVYEKQTLGVVNLYVAAGHRRNREEEEFQLAVADALAGIMARKRTEQQLRSTNESLRKAIIATVQVLVSTVEARDPYTAGHQIRVAEIACATAAEMGIEENRIEGIRVAASIHDIGKISVPVEILSKPSRINEHELALIKVHPKVAYEILKHVDFPWPIAEIVCQHHERMDGSGYPSGLLGDDILLEARIIAVADVVDAMVSHRPYRPGLGIEQTLSELSQYRGIWYDDQVVDACLRVFSEGSTELLQAA